MATPRWTDTWARVCPACSQAFTISQATLELRTCGPVEKCPNCGHEIRIRGEEAEEAIGFKLHGRS
jgi:rRNA maturation endonuclease Nob1